MSTTTLVPRPPFGRRRIVLLMAPIALIGFAACGGDDAKSDSAATTTAAAATTTTASNGGGYAVPPTASTAAPSASGVAIQLADSSVGKIVVDGAGVTLYLFVGDNGGKIGCDVGCVDTWPPLISDGSAVSLGTGLDGEDFSTIARPDGTKQITFYGHPLYHYRGDQKAGDVNGLGIGDSWYPVDGEGTSVSG